MKVNPNEIELLISAVKPEQYPETGLSEVGLSGRSNVGKSTFINSMIGRKNMARTSQQPGKTQTHNFYNIDNQHVYVMSIIHNSEPTTRRVKSRFQSRARNA